jgi:subtilisin family serine protease
MSRIRLIVTAGLVVACLAAVTPTHTRAQAQISVVDPALTAQMASAGEASYLVYMKESANLSQVSTMTDREAQGWAAYTALTSVAARTQGPLLAYLRQPGRASVVKSFFSANIVAVTSNAATLAAVAAFPEVDHIQLAPVIHLDPIPGVEEPRVNAVEWNIAKVRAPDAWARGFRGAGIVVANVDTGVKYDHAALVGKYRGNLGGGVFNHNYNWWDPSSICGIPSNVPCDNNNHGSHTMGTMVGDDGLGNQIGVAPDAKWMACKGCESGSCSSFALLECGDWILAPWNLAHASPDPTKRPHIVNNSWGGGPGDAWYQAVVTSWRNAGIFPAFSNGNSGPGCATSGSPGDYPQSFASGATDINDNLAGFSSRGPSAFGPVKPDIATPGVNIRSSIATGGYGVFSGTSMASPHTAGLVALIWSAFPTLVRDIPNTEKKLRPATQILNAALPFCGGDGPRTHPNNYYGAGRGDAFRAINFFDVYTNQANYQAGDQFKTWVSITSPQAAPLSADLYLFLLTPPSNVQTFPLGNVVIAPGTKMYDVSIVNSIVPALPAGGYEWAAVAVPPGQNPSNPANHLSLDIAIFRAP